MKKRIFKNKINLIFVFFLYVNVIGLYACDSNNNSKFSTEIINELDQVLEESFELIGAPGILVGLYVPGVGSWERSIGVSNTETGEPIEFEMHTRIGSITKTFTTQIILMLQDQGILNLDDSISMYLDGVPNGDSITLRNLGNMTSGLASYTFDPTFQDELFSDPEEAWVPEELIDIGIINTNSGCPFSPPNFPPACFEAGSSWFYSNTNLVMLGLVIEKVTNQSYQEVLKELVLKPLGLNDTSHPTDRLLPFPFTHGYTKQGSPDDSIQDSTFWSPTEAFAVGDIISTFGDLRRWAKALGTGELLSEEAKAERFSTVNLPPLTPDKNYAFGVAITNGWWGHSGEIPGFNSLILYRADIGATIVVIVNNDDDIIIDGKRTGPVFVIANRIVDIAAREAPLGEVPDEVPWEDDSLDE